MHIDPSSERDLKCDICWRNRETLIMRLLEPFERALRGVGPSGEIDQEEIDRLEREDRERERERDEKRKAAEETRRRKEDESKRKRERMRAMQEERRGKGGKFEKKKPKVEPPPAEKKMPVNEKKEDINAWNTQQVKDPDGKFAKAKGTEEEKATTAMLEKALGTDAIMTDALVQMTEKVYVKEEEEKLPIDAAVVNLAVGESEERKADRKPVVMEMTSMATDLPPKPEQLQTTANTTATTTTDPPTIQNVETNPAFLPTLLDFTPQNPSDDTVTNYPSPPRLRSRTSSIAIPPLPPRTEEEPESTIRVVQPPVETRASRRRSKSTSTPRSRSVSKSSSVIQKGKKTKTQPRRASASTASTAQPPSPVQMRLIPVDSSMFTTAATPATTSAPVPLSPTVAGKPSPEKQQRSLFSFFHPTSAPTSRSSGSESPTTISSSTTATPITAVTAVATVEKQSKGDKEDKRVLRERERKKFVKEEDNTNRRKSTRSITSMGNVNYYESSDEDEGPGI